MNETLLRSFTHITIPAEIWLRRDLSMQSKALWAELRSLHCKEQGGCYASDEYLMEFLNLKRSRLHELFKELKDKELMEVVSFNGRRTVRRAIVPEVEYVNGHLVSGKPDTRYPENRTPPIRKTGFPPYIDNKVDRKEREREESSRIVRNRTMESAESENGKCGIALTIPNTLPNTYKEREREKAPPLPKEKKKPEVKKILYGSYVSLKEGEYQTLCTEMTKDTVDLLIKKIDTYIPNRKEGPYKDYAAAIRKWYLEEKEKKTFNASSSLMNSTSPGENSDNFLSNKALCEKAENILRKNNFLCTGKGFRTSPDKAEVWNDYKDFKKTYYYKDHKPEDLKKNLLDNLLIIFPEAEAVLTSKKRIQSVEKFISKLSQNLIQEVGA